MQEFVEKSKHFFYSPKSYNESEKLKAWPNMDATKIVSQSIQVLDAIDNWGSEELEKEVKVFASDNSYGVGKVIMPLRLAVFGSLDGPSLFEIMTILGKRETLARIKSAINSMPQ